MVIKMGGVPPEVDGQAMNGDDPIDAVAIRKRAMNALECFDGCHVCSTWMPSVQTDIPILLARIDDLEAELAAVTRERDEFHAALRDLFTDDTQERTPWTSNNS